MLSFFAKGWMEMTMLRNVELTETLRAIMSRNTEYYQTDYAEDMQELLHGRQRHYLFMSYRMGTLLVPEESVYTRESSCRKGWLECGTERPDLVRAFAVRVDRRMPGRVRGDVILLDYASHAIEVEMNTVSVMDMERDVGGHLRSLHEAREGYEAISLGGYLRGLATAYLARACPYRAGFRRVCNADARALLNEEVLPVYRLNGPDYSRPLREGELKRIGEGEVFGIRAGDSGDYDRWQRESLEQYARLLQRAQNRQEAR